MSGLAKYFEEEGLATTLIALIRTQAVAMQPPRALWVPYPLGRPFGHPGDRTGQLQVIRAALELLTFPEGPVLVDFPDEVETACDDAWVCPVRFPAPEAGDDQLEAVLGEIRALAPWYEVRKSRHGRTAVGVAGLGIEDAACLLHTGITSFAERDQDSMTEFSDMLRRATADINAFYFEAATGRPGYVTGQEVTDWFWQETAAAALIQDLRHACLASANPDLKELGELFLVPETYQ